LVCSIVRIRRTQLFASVERGLVGHPPLFTRVVSVPSTRVGLGDTPRFSRELCWKTRRGRDLDVLRGLSASMLVNASVARLGLSLV
jgi:hypothetical protein